MPARTPITQNCPTWGNHSWLPSRHQLKPMFFGNQGFFQSFQHLGLAAKDSLDLLGWTTHFNQNLRNSIRNLEVIPQMRMWSKRPPMPIVRRSTPPKTAWSAQKVADRRTLGRLVPGNDDKRWPIGRVLANTFRKDGGEKYYEHTRRPWPQNQQVRCTKRLKCIIMGWQIHFCLSLSNSPILQLFYKS